MFELYVKKKDGDYFTVREAIEAVPYGEKAVIHIGEGVFCEKIFSDKKDITFIGEGMDKTVLEYGDGAFEILEDGKKRGTFRTYTAFFGGERCVVKNLTIKNTAGDGAVAGQALAVYADARECFFENVRLLGHQDTLFCAPLPLNEREKNGFMGPRVFNERLLTKQLYKGCEIYGDVDFIFGGADAVFVDCLIICNNRKKGTSDAGEREINGYITAACGTKENLGFVFRNCTVKGEDGCARGSVFLGRPWRNEAKTVFIDCRMDDSIAPERFSGWGGITKDQPDTFYGEYQSSRLDDGSLVALTERNDWVKNIDTACANEISGRADAIVKLFCS